jgi:COMPASS component SWD3
MVVRFDEEDTMAAVGCSDGIVRVYNLNTSNKLIELSTNKGQDKVACTALRWRPANESIGATSSSTILAASGSGTLFQFLAKTGKNIFEKKEEDNYIFALDYNAKGTLFATAGKDCVIRVYDEETKSVKHHLEGVSWHKPGHNNRLFGLRFSPDDPNVLLSGGWDQNVNWSSM